MSTKRQSTRLALLRAFAALTSPLHAPSLAPLPPNPSILLLRPDHIGDLLFVTPVLRALRQCLPDAHIACMVGPWGKAVLENNPNLDELILCEFPGFHREHRGPVWAPYRELLACANRLRVRQFDLALVLRFDHWWGALLAYQAGIARRIGYDIPENRPFLTLAVPYVSLRHEVLQNLTLVEQVLHTADAVPIGVPSTPPTTEIPAMALQFVITQQDQDFVTSYLQSKGVPKDVPLVAIHPGAGSAVKLWRPEAWAEVADSIVRRWHARIVITGSRDELPLAWSVYVHMQEDAIVVAGQTSLGQLAALFQRCHLVLGPDCGPLHLAVAVGIPTVHLYGPVDALKFGPWGPADRHRVVTSGRCCIPCNRLDHPEHELAAHPCVREITSAIVLNSVEELFPPVS